MCVLACTAISNDTLVSIDTTAKTYNISKSHLMEVVTSLVKGGFLVSVHGKGDGLRSANAPEKINIGTVTRHLKPMQAVECTGDNSEHLIIPSRRLTGIITGAIKVFSDHSDQYSLQNLLGKPACDTLYTPRTPIDETRGMAD